MSGLYFLLFTLIALNGCAQDQTQTQAQTQEEGELPSLVREGSGVSSQIGGPCEGCEAALEYGDRQLAWVDTLEDFKASLRKAQGPKIEVSGVIYQNDGKTPAKDIILYVYHTDQTGNYNAYHNETGWGHRHGSLRTWLRTDDQGRYKFYTLRPASYPGSKNPAHIHATIKEPGKSPYWIDDFLFDDDPFLTKEQRNYIQGRGGYSGVLKNGIQTADVTKYTRDITLGLNVDGYR